MTQAGPEKDAIFCVHVHCCNNSAYPWGNCTGLEHVCHLSRKDLIEAVTLFVHGFKVDLSTEHDQVPSSQNTGGRPTRLGQRCALGPARNMVSDDILSTTVSGKFAVFSDATLPLQRSPRAIQAAALDTCLSLGVAEEVIV